MEYTEYTVAVALRQNNKLWMSQRIQTKNFHGIWQFAGGKCNKHENPIDGSIRELEEETNLNINYNRLRYVGCIMNDPTTKCCYVYQLDLRNDEIPVRTENTMTDWMLLTYDEALSRDLMPGLREIIIRFKKESLQDKD